MPEGIGRLEWKRGGGTRATDQLRVTPFSFSEVGRKEMELLSALQGGKNNWFRLKGERDKFSFSEKLGGCSILKVARDRRRVAMYNKVLLYTAVLRPILSYGCPVWGYAAKTNIKILAQNSIIRTITKANRYTINSDIYKALKLHPFKNQPRGNSLSSTDQPQCLLSTPAHSKHPWFPPQTFTSFPLLRPATTSATTILPASQSGSSMHPIQDYTTPTGNTHCSVMGRRNALNSMSQ
ncbi:hypothetical protein TNCV_4793021 [Trichonephila clavipes]|nr:hypothetical protein TNCV_4793021 [Trichonephila clavipes]